MIKADIEVNDRIVVCKAKSFILVYIRNKRGFLKFSLHMRKSNFNF